MKLSDPLAIQILGINRMGEDYEAGNDLICNGRDIPWLQETSTSPVWARWDVVWRDVVILDAENERFATFNLTLHSLSHPANYDSLKTLLLEAAGTE